MDASPTVLTGREVKGSGTSFTSFSCWTTWEEIYSCVVGARISWSNDIWRRMEREKMEKKRIEEKRRGGGEIEVSFGEDSVYWERGETSHNRTAAEKTSNSYSLIGFAWTITNTWTSRVHQKFSTWASGTHRSASSLSISDPPTFFLTAGSIVI